MARTNLAGMDFESLLELRKEIDDHLLQRRSELEKQLTRLDGVTRVVRGGNKLRGVRVPPKYRDPKTGMTWSGRGQRAKWLVGKKLSDYLIDKKRA